MKILTMNEIVKTDNLPIIATINNTVVAKKIVLAVDSVKVSELMYLKTGRIKVAQEIEKLFIRGKQMTGFRLENLDNPRDRADINRLCQNVIFDFGWLRINELKVIFEEGLKGNLGKIYGINPAQVNDWIKEYYVKYRGPIITAHLKLDEQEKGLTEEQQVIAIREIQKRTIRYLIAFYDECLQKKEIPLNQLKHFTYVWYQLFEKYGIIALSLEEKNKIFEVEREKNKVAKRSLSPLISIRKEDDVKNACRYKILLKTIQDMVAKEVNINTYIKNADK